MSQKLNEDLSRKRFLWDIDFGLSEQGITGAVSYDPVPWINGTGDGIEIFFETLLGYRFNDYLSFRAGYQYHTIWATNEGWDAVNSYNKECDLYIKSHSYTLGFIFYAPLGRFEPYLEVRYGGNLKTTAKEEIEYVGQNSTFVNNSYSGLGYTNYQIGIGGCLWLSSSAAFTFSFRYNVEEIDDLPNTYGLQPIGDFTASHLINHWGLMFAF